MSEELKPCPFCSARGLVAKGINSEGWFGYCEGCGAEAEGALTKEAAIASWNRRATPTVKPLEWDHKAVEGFACSRGGERAYAIMLSRFRVYGVDGDHDGAAEFSSEEEAKAAAQADYTRRILSAIEGAGE